MKHIITIALFLLGTITYAQSDLQIVKIKNEDKSVSVYAVNNSKVPHTIKVSITMEGMKLKTPLAPSVEIIPGIDKLVATLIPTAPKTSYKINFRSVEDELKNEVAVPDVTIYTKNGHDKSTELRLYLQKHEIPFYEYNTTYDKKSNKVYEKMLDRRGIKKSEAKLPVVIIKGEVFHKIKNMEKFLKEHF